MQYRKKMLTPAMLLMTAAMMLQLTVTVFPAEREESVSDDMIVIEDMFMDPEEAVPEEIMDPEEAVPEEIMDPEEAVPEEIMDPEEATPGEIVDPVFVLPGVYDEESMETEEDLPEEADPTLDGIIEDTWEIENETPVFDEESLEAASALLADDGTDEGITICYSDCKGEFSFAFSVSEPYTCTISKKSTFDLSGALVIPRYVIVRYGDGVSGLQEGEVRTYAVTEIGKFNGNTQITSLTIPEGVLTISEEAFEGCTGLKGDLTIPDSVISLGPEAFRECTGLDGTLTLGSGLTEIAGSAFFNCSFTGSLSIPHSVTSIGGYAFSGCSRFTGMLKIPASVTNIGIEAFKGCTGFTGLTLLSGTTGTAINLRAFQNCSGMKGSLIIPDTVTEIKDSAFEGCGFDGDLTLPAGLTTLYDQAFACPDIAGTLTIPDSHIAVNGTASPFKGMLKVKRIVNSSAVLSLKLLKNFIELGDYTSYFAQRGSAVRLNITGSLETGTWFRGVSMENVTASDIPPQTYSGQALEPALTAVYDDYSGFDITPLVSGTDYTVVYAYNINAGTATVTIEGIGIYDGSVTKTFIIMPRAISTASVNLDTASCTYDGSARTPAVTAKDGATTLSEGADYTVIYSDNTNAGTAVATITGLGNYTGTITKNFTIAPKAITPDVTLSSVSCTWNGKTQKPAATVKDGGKVLADSDYTVSFASGCEDVGTCNITVTMKGNYSGSRTVSFVINPKGTSIKKLTKARKAITVKWKKQASRMSSKRITGYQIQLAANKAFTKSIKTVNVSGYKKTSKKVTGLKGGKKYYVRIRTYRKAGGVTYYSSWSKVKTIKTKK